MFAGCQCWEPVTYVSRPHVYDGGQPDYVDAPCNAVGEWFLTHTNAGASPVSDSCLPPDGISVKVDEKGCEAAVPTTLPGVFVSDTPPTLYRCRLETEACRIFVDMSATHLDTRSRVSDTLKLTINLRQLGDGTFVGRTEMRLKSCTNLGVSVFDTVAAP